MLCTKGGQPQCEVPKSSYDASQQTPFHIYRRDEKRGQAVAPSHLAD